MVKVSVCIPRHCSALADEHYNAANDENAFVIFCHQERMVWHFFRPLFSGEENTEAKNSNATIVAYILLRAFLKCTDESSDRGGSICEHQCIKNEHHTNAQESGDENTHDGWWMTSSFVLPSVLLTDLSNEYQKHIMTTKSSSDNQSGRIDQMKNMSIYILPPNQTPSPFASLRAEQIFASALVKQENLNIRLQTLNAYVATLGGGYFLCKYLKTAVRLARYQRSIAYALDDHNLAMKCTVNEAYNYIHAGMVNHAKVLIDSTIRQAMGYISDGSIGRPIDETVLGMCHSARWFAERVEEAGLKAEEQRALIEVKANGTVENESTSKSSSNEVELTQVKANNDGTFTATNDDFQRIRIVKSR